MNQIWNESSIVEKIREIIHSTFGVDISSEPDTTPIAVLGLDSMGMLDVIMSLEDALGQKLKNIDLPKEPTLRDVALMVSRNLQSGPHA